MNKCLKITVTVGKWRESWDKEVRKKAEKYKVEGMMQFTGKHKAKIAVCGVGDNLDDFIDYLYELVDSAQGTVDELEPFIKERDYRGLFRVVSY